MSIEKCSSEDILTICDFHRIMMTTLDIIEIMCASMFNVVKRNPAIDLHKICSRLFLKLSFVGLTNHGPCHLQGPIFSFSPHDLYQCCLYPFVDKIYTFENAVLWFIGSILSPSVVTSM